MTLKQYEELREKRIYEPLWLDLLNASGFAGCTRQGHIVDRRYYPDAMPVAENRMMGIAKPKKV
ncbi:hypothetical protein T190115A13A_270046 [Tenacibaculum sp. 190524A02b]|uniref:Uncharacterized protein n=1 Tax=Tenacibaculum vairaonense TaxID=3137860 RepID=A0ABP1FDV8_9FLAO